MLKKIFEDLDLEYNALISNEETESYFIKFSCYDKEDNCEQFNTENDQSIESEESVSSSSQVMITYEKSIKYISFFEVYFHRIPKKKHSKVLKYINELNSRILYGLFYFNTEVGFVSFKIAHSLECGDSNEFPLSEAQFLDYISAMLKAKELFYEWVDELDVTTNY